MKLRDWDDMFDDMRDADGRLHVRLYYVHPRRGVPIGWLLEEFRNSLGDGPQILAARRVEDRDALAVLVACPTYPPIDGYEPFPVWEVHPA